MNSLAQTHAHTGPVFAMKLNSSANISLARPSWVCFPFVLFSVIIPSGQTGRKTRTGKGRQWSVGGMKDRRPII